MIPGKHIVGVVGLPEAVADTMAEYALANGALKTVQEEEVLRPGEDETPRRGVLVHDSLNVRRQVRTALDFVQDHTRRELPKEAAGVP